MNRPPSSGAVPVPGKTGRADLLEDGRLVASGSPEAVEAAARLFELEGKVGCVSPNGRTDGHGVYVTIGADGMFCAFCKQPVGSKRSG